MSLFSELKRRNVLRVALLYVVASWLILQITDVTISLLELPSWTGRLVFFLILVIFPIVMIFSWVYEITPDGIKREEDIESDPILEARTARKLNIAVVLLLTLALGGLIADRLMPEEATAPMPDAVSDAASVGPPENSIAVLPFLNMSADKESGYFSDGLSEELLNLLAKNSQLRVAARTSAFSFKGSDADILEIADKLRVAHVLEGSVRKSGDSIRVTAQLIKASDGYHVWSETWERELTDVFAIQDEIAAAVARALKLTLLDDAPRSRVTDPRAFELYLRSKAAANLVTKESLEAAVTLLNDALEIDPNYAQGWTLLGTVQTNQVGRGTVAKAIGVERARTAFERALQLDADNVGALSGLAWIGMFHEWDFDKAAQLLGKARALEPGNVVVLNSTAVLVGAFGQIPRKISLLETALVHDPLSMSVLHNLIVAYTNAGMVADASQLVEKMTLIAPESFFVIVDAAWIKWFEGDAESALQMFQQVNGPIGTWGSVFALSDLGRVDEVEEAMQQLRVPNMRPSLLAAVHAYIGEHDQAFEAYDRAFDSRDDWLIQIREFQFLESLHQDPRWDALLQKLGISDADAERIGM